MLTSYITSRNLKPLSSVYSLDEQIDLLSKEIPVDGNLDVVYTPLLSCNNDFVNNNYSLLNLTSNINLENITNFKLPNNPTKVYSGTLSILDDFQVPRQLKFSDARDDILTDVIYYDQTFNTPVSSITDLNFFEFDFTSSNFCTVAHLYGDSTYYLCFDPAKTQNDQFNLNFVILSAFNATNEHTRQFNYNYDEDNNLLTLQVNYNGTAYQVVRAAQRLQLELITTPNPIQDISNCIFTLSTFKLPNAPKVTVEWGSYTRDLNLNSIKLDSNRSLYHQSNNFLVNREYYNFKLDENKIPFNLLTLKNQLNLNHDQGRGNVFLNESEVSYREYDAIFAGGNQEQGLINLQLGYNCYSTPYTFTQGKTTWFHMPQSMYPYSRLNVRSTNLIKAGAIAGDHPLRSDKIFKKIANYASTSNQGDATGEETGVWLCTWLSGGPGATTPIWMDRFYTPSATTPYQAISARPASITFVSSYSCLNLPEGVYDTPSSLTFEPGCWYAYSHIGKSDALQNEQNLFKHLLQQDFTTYLKNNGLILDAEVEDSFNTYTFTGSELTYFDVSDFNVELNNLSINFWAYSNDWQSVKGYQLGGNYNDYGLGIFNHNTVTPFIFYLKEGKIIVLNRDLELLTTYDSGLSAFGNVVNIFRRDALNSFHALTDKQYLIEYDMKETLVDATTALSGNKGLPIYTTNDESVGLVLYADKTFKAINLYTNNIQSLTSLTTVGNNNDVQEIVKLINGLVVRVAGTQTQVVGSSIYFLSGNTIAYYNSLTNTLSTFLPASNTDTYETLMIDRNTNIWTSSGNKIFIYNNIGVNTATLTLTADSDISATPVKIKNITFLENFESGDLITDVLVSASGSTPGNIVLYRLNDKYEVQKIKSIQTNTDILISPDPANHRFNYSYLLNRYALPGYTFKIRLFNPLNTEDVEIPQITVLAKDLNSGYHQFSIILNCQAGILQIYVDGQLYDSVYFTPNKYIYTKLITNRIFAGATPYYGGLLLYDFLDKNKTQKTSYMCKDFKVQNFKLYNKVLDYFDINMLYQTKIPSKDLIWDVPSGKRNFIDSISRYFKHRIPGGKSGLYNLWVNSNLLTEESKQLLNVAIQQKVREITPAYSKLNKINWFSNNPAISGDYQFPYFPGNTLTTSKLQT